MPFALVLDSLVAILLVITIGFAWVLNKRLGHLRQDKGELEKVVLNFHTATDRAEDSITRLKTNVESLQECMEKAETLREDLVFLSERGSTMADRLDVVVCEAKKAEGTLAGPNTGQTGAGTVPEPESVSAPSDPPPIPDGIKPQAGEDIKPKRPVLKADGRERQVPDDNQGVSEAERDLLKALRSAE